MKVQNSAQENSGLPIATNALNQAIQVNTQAYSYDANGNLLSDGTNTYQWDAENRLIGLKKGTTTATFKYDGLGRRLETGVGNKKYRHLWCEGQLCQTRGGPNFAIVQATYFDEGVQTPTASYLAFRDQLGSVRQLRSRSSASSIGTFEYGPYGEKLIASGSQTTSSGPRFAGMFYDNDVGLYFTQYRVYSPTLERWLSRDPIGVAGGINLYSYAEASPMMKTDPLGLQANDSCKSSPPPPPPSCKVVAKLMCRPQTCSPGYPDPNNKDPIQWPMDGKLEACILVKNCFPFIEVEPEVTRENRVGGVRG